MTTVNLHDLILDELTDHLAAMFKQILPTEEYRRLLVPMLRELATSQPIEPERLAALAEVPLEQTLDMLRQAPSEWDPSGKRLVGLGLTSNPTPHRFEIAGSRVIHPAPPGVTNRASSNVASRQQITSGFRKPQSGSVDETRVRPGLGVPGRPASPTRSPASNDDIQPGDLPVASARADRAQGLGSSAQLSPRVDKIEYTAQMTK